MYKNLSALVSQALKRPTHKPNPVVGIFAPSSGFAEERYQKGRAVLSTLGFEIYEPDGLREQSGYLAGPDHHRVKLLHDLLENEQVDILWAARGGYGLHRILPHLDPNKIAQANKTIVGFSDICALHALNQSQAKLISIHGPVVTQLGDLGEDDLAHLQAVLRQEWQNLEYLADGETLVAGEAEGPLLGGCLSVLTPLVGTPYLPSMTGAILLLEDVGEVTYRIDRMLTHLKLAGIFNQVAGIGVGDFHACHPRNETEPTMAELLRDIFSDIQIPVLSGLPFGHGSRNRALPLGCRARLITHEKRMILHPNE